jgi:DNA-binding beta-propeller fold protein YncE
MFKLRGTLFSFLLIFNSLAIAVNPILAVVEENSDRLSFYNTETGIRQGSLKLGFLPHEIAVTKDGKIAYVSNFGIRDYDSGSGTPGVSISVIDLTKQVEKYRLYTHDAMEQKDYQDIDSAPHGLKLRPPYEKQLYVNVEHGGKVLVFDVESKKIIKKFDVSPNTHNLFFSEDGKTLWLMAGKDGVIRMNADSGEITGSIALPSAVRGLKYTPDKRNLMLSAVNQIVLVDSDTLVIKKQFTNLNLGPVLYSDMTPDQKYILAPAPFDHQVGIIDVATGQVIKRMVTGLNPMNILVSPDGRYAYVSNATDKHLSKIDMNTLEMSEISTHDGPNGLAFIPEWHKKKHQKLTMGVVLPLSGKDSAKGRDMLRGYEYWKSMVIKGGGLLIGNQVYEPEIVYLNSNSDTEQVKTLSQELVSQHQVQIFLSPYGQDAYEQERHIAEFHHIIMTPPLIGDETWNPDNIAQGYDYFVSTKMYENHYVAQYNFKPSSWSAMATAVGLKFQKTCEQVNSLDYQQFMSVLNDTHFQLFY